jgi:hypothetical protein
MKLFENLLDYVSLEDEDNIKFVHMAFTSEVSAQRYSELSGGAWTQEHKLVKRRVLGCKGFRAYTGCFTILFENHEDRSKWREGNRAPLWKVYSQDGDMGLSLPNRIICADLAMSRSDYSNLLSRQMLDSEASPMIAVTSLLPRFRPLG